MFNSIGILIRRFLQRRWHTSLIYSNRHSTCRTFRHCSNHIPCWRDYRQICYLLAVVRALRLPRLRLQILDSEAVYRPQAFQVRLQITWTHLVWVFRDQHPQTMLFPVNNHKSLVYSMWNTIEEVTRFVPINEKNGHSLWFWYLFDRNDVVRYKWTVARTRVCVTELLMSAGSKILPFMSHSSSVLFNGSQTPQQSAFLPNGGQIIRSQGAEYLPNQIYLSKGADRIILWIIIIQMFQFHSAVGKCAGDAVYNLKDWCEIVSPQQQYHQQQQALHQKGGWNNIGPIADWTSIDPAIVSSSRPVPFQATATWQFPHVHSPHTPSHSTQQVDRRALDKRQVVY